MVKSFYIHKNFQPLTQTLSESLSLKDIKNITERDFLKASHLFGFQTVLVHAVIESF